jgi:hypothetical protein
MIFCGYIIKEFFLKCVYLKGILIIEAAILFSLNTSLFTIIIGHEELHSNGGALL